MIGCTGLPDATVAPPIPFLAFVASATNSQYTLFIGAFLFSRV